MPRRPTQEPDSTQHNCSQDGEGYPVPHCEEGAPRGPDLVTHQVEQLVRAGLARPAMLVHPLGALTAEFLLSHSGEVLRVRVRHGLDGHCTADDATTHHGSVGTADSTPVISWRPCCAVRPSPGADWGLPRVRVRSGVLAWALVCVAASPVYATPGAGSQTRDESPDGRGPSPRYEALREAEVSHVGQIRDGRVRLDRFEIELTDGHLYLAPPVGGTPPALVFLGDGVLRGYPPDAVEHHQLHKLSDEHSVEAAFDRLVVWSVGDLPNQFRALATPPAEDAGDERHRGRQSTAGEPAEAPARATAQQPREPGAGGPVATRCWNPRP